MIRSFRALRLPAYCAVSFLRLLFFSTELVFAISQIILCSLPLLAEGEVESLEQRPGFVVRLRSRTNDDVHAPDLIDLVVVDLRKHDVFLDAHGIVAAAIEALRVQPAKVADARQRD